MAGTPGGTKVYEHPANVKGPILTSQDAFDSAALGGATTTTICDVDLSVRNSLTANDERTLVNRLDHVSGNVAKYTFKELDDDWPEQTDYEEESETCREISVLRRIHSSDPGLSGPTPRFMYSVQQLDDYKWLETIREIEVGILSYTLNEQHNVEYYFPSYLDATDPFFVVSFGSGFSIASNKSSDVSLKLPARFETTYHTSPPAASTLFQFVPIDIDFAATNSLRIYAQNVITDGGTLQFRGAYPDPGAIGGWTWVDLDFEFGASSPTTTAYKALMGTEQLIGEEISRWKFCLWKRTKIFLTLPNLNLTLGGGVGY